MNRVRAVVTSLIFLLIGGAGVLTWVMWVQPELPDASSAPSALAQSQIENRNSRTLAATPAAEASDLARNLNSPATDIRADLKIVSDVIETFRTNFLSTGNPTGANFEITAALTGKNIHGLVLIPPSHPAINRNGELCDRWGTPFFFHAASATKMEIRSAGPDKTMWTDDDAVLSP